MGLFNNLFKTTKKASFTPDLKKTEYENWLLFLDNGGTTAEWDKMKKENNWKFATDTTIKQSNYEKQFRPLFDEYSRTAALIKAEWSLINKEKLYEGAKANSFEILCKQNIEIYKKMVNLENKHKKDHLQEAEGFKRLAMFYEKQGQFEKSILICKEAIILGDIKSMRDRLNRMIKKAKREPTSEELQLIQ